MVDRTMSLLGNVPEKLSKLVSDETYKDIEDFLSPRFDVNTIGNNKRQWKIVCDGYGKWHEIKPRINKEEKQDHARSGNNPIPTTLIRRRERLSSNNMIDSVRCSSKPPPRDKTYPSIPRHDYSTLSTITRSNIFPGVGNFDWHSQSNADYSEAALNLGKRRGKELREEFYGITRDEMGAWNEASVHHERMKKSWDHYLESLRKVGRVQIQIQTPEENAGSNVHEISPKPKKIRKQVKKSDRGKQDTKLEEEFHTDTEENKIKINEEPLPPKLSEPAAEDDDFWDFYDQPFVKS